MASAGVVSSRLSPLTRSSTRILKRPISWTQPLSRSTVGAVDFVETLRSKDDSNSRRSHQCQVFLSCRPYSTLNSSTKSTNDIITKSHPRQNQSIRKFTLPTLECIEYTPTIFGLTPFLLTTFHSVGIPYYTGIALTNIIARSSMIPLVIQGAKTSIGIGVVAPEVQYLLANFGSDFRSLKEKEKESGNKTNLRRAQAIFVRETVLLLRRIFQLHKINLLDVFKSPLLQIPIFWYFALDLRYVINGADPILAQALVDTTFLHITDLTEPDPYYALPIVTGALLYLNVETAMGKRALSGETSSHSRLALFMKDFFQSLAIFMPCFMVQQPSGIQIYLMTSMVFSLCQSVAMRNDSVREAVGLPPMYHKPKGMEEGKFVKEFMEEMRKKQEAKARGDFILGEGVLKLIGNQRITSGRKKKSSIEWVKKEVDLTKAVTVKLPQYTITTLWVNPELFARRPTPLAPPTFNTSIPGFESENALGSMPEVPSDVMEKANRGEKPVKIEMASKELLEQNKKSESQIDINRLKMKRGKQKGKKGR